MAEKNTLSILETIKKKMHKLDQKSEKTVAPASSNEEFQYISSTAKVETAAVLETKVSEQKIDTTMPKFEDDLDLEDLGKEIAPPIPNTPPVAEASKNKNSEALDDFNLDDFDLDSEAKTPAIAAPTAEVKQNEVGDFSEDDIEDFEDEIDIAEDEIVEEEVEEEHQDLLAEDVDWLGNKIITDEIEEIPAVIIPKVDDLDLTFGEEAHEEEDELDLEHLEEEHVEETHEEEDALDLEVEEEDDLDLEHLDEEEYNEEEHEEEDALDLESGEEDDLELEHLDEEEHEEEDALDLEVEEEKEDDLDLEHLDEEEYNEEEHEEEDALDLENHEEEPAPKEISEDDDLDFVELEKHEEKKPAMEIKEESHEEDDLNFDDLESLPPKKLEPQIHKDLDDDLDLELEIADKKLEALKIQTPPFLAPKDTLANGIDLFDLEMKEKPISQTASKTASNNEIDLEFEKEIMGLKPASLPEKSVEDFISNPASFQPQVAQQNYGSQSQVSVMNSPKGTNNTGNGIYDSTLRQVGDSVRKLIDAKNVVSGISTFSQGPAFVELATHLMEPKLEKWLNEHLPELVEKIVREEIKKIIPKD